VISYRQPDNAASPVCGSKGNIPQQRTTVDRIRAERERERERETEKRERQREKKRERERTSRKREERERERERIDEPTGGLIGSGQWIGQ
jgi:type IV secretory pathway VirB10-like protein